jgi:hypothetical protein
VEGLPAVSSSVALAEEEAVAQARGIGFWFCPPVVPPSPAPAAQESKKKRK